MLFPIRIFLSVSLLVAPSLVWAQSGAVWSAIESQGWPSARALKTSVPVAHARGASASVPLFVPNSAQPPSGQRLKSEGSPITGALDGVEQLRPVRFVYLPGQGENGPQYGLRPSDLARVYPELVRSDLLTGVQSVNTAQLTPILVEALKELMVRLRKLESQQLELAAAYAHLSQENTLTAPAPALSLSAAPSLLRRLRGGNKQAVEEARPAPPAVEIETIP